MTAAQSTCEPKLSGDSTCSAVDQLRILLVDDDNRYLRLCKRYLDRSKDCRFDVHTAVTLRGALGLYSDNEYDCLVIDYLLPDGTGTDLISILSHSSNKGCNRVTPPAIITTSDGGEDAATDALRAGAVDYQSKRNLNTQSLSRSICNAVDKFRLSESLRLRNAELLEANKGLRRNRQEIMHFYHTVSHEVKTPLAAAREFISLVQDGAEGEISSGQNRLLQLAMDSCDQIKKQFTELLDMTRLESGKLELVRSATRVSTLTTRSITSVSEFARSRQVSVQQICVQDSEVFADPDRIVQVLSNLLHNAIKFSDENGMVYLKTRFHEQSGQLEFCVEDFGCGISREEQTAVFDRLYQSAHQRTQTSACGLGLGLAIAKEIVSLHGSRLSLSSELNKGSAFVYQLPIVKPEMKTWKLS